MDRPEKKHSKFLSWINCLSLDFHSSLKQIFPRQKILFEAEKDLSHYEGRKKPKTSSVSSSIFEIPVFGG